jgi:putative hydrolase of the HAD superfamily
MTLNFVKSEPSQVEGTISLMKLPQAIIFDYGNVLDIPDDWTAWLAARDTLAAEHGLSGQALWEKLFKDEPWQQVKRGKISEQEYWNTVLQPLNYADEAAQRQFASRFFVGRERVHPEMLALLRELRLHYRLAILSNTHIYEMERWLVEQRGLAGLFELVISSAQVGMAKPDAEIYQLTLERLGLQPHEALFIDDLVRNTSVAESIGLPCIVFQSPAQLRRELEARGIIPIKQKA